MAEISGAEIEARLYAIPKEKHTAWQDMVKAKKAYLVAKQDYKKNCAITKLSAKAANPKHTQTDLDAMAIRDGDIHYTEMINKEAFYQGTVGAWQKLDDEFVGLRKVASLKGVYQAGQ